MAFGLQVFDQFGNLRVHISDRLTRVLATSYITLGPGASQFIAHPPIYTSGFIVKCSSSFDEYWGWDRPTQGTYKYVPGGIVVINNTITKTKYMTASWLGI